MLGHERSRLCFPDLYRAIFACRCYPASVSRNGDIYHGGAHNGGDIIARAPGVPQACPGMRADGSNKYTVVLDTWRTREEVPSPGYLVTYVYHMDQGGRWGDQFFPSGRVVPDGRELFYRNGESVMVVTVETDPELRFGTPNELFSGAYDSRFRGDLSRQTMWDIHPDGKRFLMLKQAETMEGQSTPPIPSKINIVMNWFEELKQRVPVD